MSAAVELRHGYTLADLHAIARLAVHVAGYGASDWRERYDTAYSAIAEGLYAAEHWIARPTLVQAGQLAIYEVTATHRRHHGYYKAKTFGADHGAASSPAFLAYWWNTCGAIPTPSCEGRVVERMSLNQIMPMLSEGQRDAILALAAHGTYQAAAEAMGMSQVAFKSQISRARRRFLAWWHEGEEPSKPWGCDRRADRKDDGRSRTKPMALFTRRKRDAARRAA